MIVNLQSWKYYPIKAIKICAIPRAEYLGCFGYIVGHGFPLVGLKIGMIFRETTEAYLLRACLQGGRVTLVLGLP